MCRATVEAKQIAAANKPALEKVTDHVWCTTHTDSLNWFLISESGKALVMDYGYMSGRGMLAPEYSKPYRRRALLHSLDALKQNFGIDRVDVALISHFTTTTSAACRCCSACSAHNAGRPKPSPTCWPSRTHTVSPATGRSPSASTAASASTRSCAGRNSSFALRHERPTRFASLIGFEADGKRFAHTGDQYFFMGPDGKWPDRANGPIVRWDDKMVFQNHVYRNGALLDGYAQSGDWLLTWRPDIVLTGHQMAMHTDA